MDCANRSPSSSTRTAMPVIETTQARSIRSAVHSASSERTRQYSSKYVLLRNLSAQQALLAALLLSVQVIAGSDQAPHEMVCCSGCVFKCRVEIRAGNCSLTVGIVAVGYLSDRQFHFHRGCVVAHRHWSVCVLHTRMSLSAINWYFKKGRL